MMQDTMNSIGGMMWGMALTWLLVILVFVLGIAALAKYLLTRN